MIRPLTLALLVSLVACSGSPPPADETHASESPSYVDIVEEQSGAFASMIDATMASLQVPGGYVGIVGPEGLVFSRAYGTETISEDTPFSAKSRARLASATKVLTSLVFYSLAEDGLMPLDATLGSLDPELPAAWQRITIAQILNHTSGLPPIVYRDDFNAMSGEEQLALTEEDLFSLISSSGLDFEPGEDWRYQQSGYMLLAAVARSVTGKSWDQLLAERVFEPAGLRHTSYTSPETQAAAYEVVSGEFVPKTGYYPKPMSMGGGYDTTGEDMQRLFEALNNGAIVSNSFLLNDVLKDDRLHQFGSNVAGEGYGPATVVERYETGKSIGHSGGGGLANIRYSPEAEIGIIVLTNRTGGTNVAAEITLAIEEALFGAALKAEAPADP
ncbi:MAG: serine hydrolase domain-containing protein [Pseudomonadota bacterium]